MRTIIQRIGVCLAVLTSPSSATALAGTSAFGPKGKRFGAGIIAGEPTGITMKGYVSPQVALDLIVSWSFVDEAFAVIGDVTYDFFDIATSSAVVHFPFYAGAGGKIGFDRRGKNDGRTIGGIRVPIGTRGTIDQAPHRDLWRGRARHRNSASDGI